MPSSEYQIVKKLFGSAICYTHVQSHQPYAIGHERFPIPFQLYP